jgi:hypothetical protein
MDMSASETILSVAYAGWRLFTASNVSMMSILLPLETSLYKPGLPEIARIVFNITIKINLIQHKKSRLVCRKACKKAPCKAQVLETFAKIEL